MTARQYRFRAHRIFTKSLNFPEVNDGSSVLASLTELGIDGPLIGGATMKVYNVAADNGVVHLRGEIDWDDDLEIRATVVAF